MCFSALFIIIMFIMIIIIGCLCPLYCLLRVLTDRWIERGLAHKRKDVSILPPLAFTQYTVRESFFFLTFMEKIVRLAQSFPAYERNSVHTLTFLDTISVTDFVDRIKYAYFFPFFDFYIHVSVNIYVQTNTIRNQKNTLCNLDKYILTFSNWHMRLCRVQLCSPVRKRSIFSHQSIGIVAKCTLFKNRLVKIKITNTLLENTLLENTL